MQQDLFEKDDVTLLMMESVKIESMIKNLRRQFFAELDVILDIAEKLDEKIEKKQKQLAI